ncbi:MAG TPA: cysteate synthase [Candidatus Elarobacter sp.]
MRHYRLQCTGCGARYDDDGVRLDCDRVHGPALLKSVYDARTFAPADEPSIARYAAWLPVDGPLATDARTGVYRSEGVAKELGLANLWIAFSGWWPERGASLASATFKELEAVAVLGRLPDDGRTLVIASAGNTAAAFARIAGERDVPVLIVIPLDAWETLARTVRIAPSVRVAAVEGGTYDDAIRLSKVLAAREGYVLEGGVRNVGRRDGMGTAMLAATEAIGLLPDVYVQAVGSGAGALAAHEAALRLIADGRFGSTAPRLLLAQNAPFTPIHDAWARRGAALDERDPNVVRDQLGRLGAAVLSNQAPPYATQGGLRAALAQSDGLTRAVSNDEMARAMLLFAEREGIDVEPAAGVALAALAQAVRDGEIARDATVMLHVTGGGRARLRPVIAEQRPALIVRRDETEHRSADDVAALFAAT